MHAAAIILTKEMNSANIKYVTIILLFIIDILGSVRRFPGMGAADSHSLMRVATYVRM
jgi:hypothetical protein